MDGYSWAFLSLLYHLSIYSQISYIFFANDGRYCYQLQQWFSHASANVFRRSPMRTILRNLPVEARLQRSLAFRENCSTSYPHLQLIYRQ